MSAAPIVALLQGARLSLASEKGTQADIAALLDRAGIQAEREHRLSDRDIPDFMLPGGIALEVKLRGQSKSDVFRQLVRYAAFEQVRELVLATNLSMGLPREICGKPAFYASLGRGWL